MHTFGTGIGRGLNAKLMGKAVAQPGIDHRYWCSLAEVGSVDTETGEFDGKDPHAICNESAGVSVDVMLQPLGQPCTCLYAGIQAGEITIYAPIRPGDVVLVEMPDGDLTTPVITHIINSRSKRQPTEGGKPIFDNNRLLIHAKSVPIDIRTAGGVRVLLEQDGTATVTGASVVLDSDDTRLGGSGATEQSVLGTTQAAELTTLLGLVASAFTEISTSIGSSASATAAVGCGTFVAELQNMLSSKVRVAT
jgi:hypothetical protein